MDTTEQQMDSTPAPTPAPEPAFTPWTESELRRFFDEREIEPRREHDEDYYGTRNYR
jgi:hypothetical protein